MTQTIYEDHGYTNREDYLEGLSEEFDIPLIEVRALADILGEDEDFDALVTQLEDYSAGWL